MLLGFSLPNPFDLGGEVLSRLMDLGSDAVGDVAEDIVGKVIGGLAGAVVGALVDLAASILGFFWEASEPELSADWFSGDGSPYAQMVALSAPLLVVFVFAGIIQGALKGDTAGMLRMMFARLPGAVVAMTVTVALGDALIRVTDEMSRQILEGFRQDIEQVGTVLMSLHIAGSLPGQLLLLLFGFIGLLAAMFLVVLLFVRAALIYLIAAFAPLVFAAGVWEPMRGAVRKLAEIAFALIVSKLAIALALAVSAAALVGSWPGDQLSGIPTPEYTAAQADQSVTQSIGILLSAVVMFVVAAFMPFVVFRLLPVAEGALVAHGVSGGAGRAARSMSNTATRWGINPAQIGHRAYQKRLDAKNQKQGEGKGDQQSNGNAATSPARRGADALKNKTSQGANGYTNGNNSQQPKQSPKGNPTGKGQRRRGGQNSPAAQPSNKKNTSGGGDSSPVGDQSVKRNRRPPSKRDSGGGGDGGPAQRPTKRQPQQQQQRQSQRPAGGSQRRGQGRPPGVSGP